MPVPKASKEDNKAASAVDTNPADPPLEELASSADNPAISLVSVPPLDKRVDTNNLVASKVATKVDNVVEVAATLVARWAISPVSAPPTPVDKAKALSATTAVKPATFPASVPKLPNLASEEATNPALATAVAVKAIWLVTVPLVATVEPVEPLPLLVPVTAAVRLATLPTTALLLSKQFLGRRVTLFV